jgi:hypothetical protein
LSGRGAASAAGGGAMTGDVKTVAQITNEGLGMKDRPDYFVVRGVVTFIRHEEGKQPFYQACPNETQAQDPRTGELKTQKCGKKVQAQDGRYRCEKCGIDMDTYEARYILRYPTKKIEHLLTSSSAHCIFSYAALLLLIPRALSTCLRSMRLVRNC